MLQWMGGSRRKVTTSRKSTQKRQKQYFEQRRRQQQHQQEAADGGNYSEGNRTYFQRSENNRSLDILSLLNISAVAQKQKSDCTVAREKLEDHTLNYQTLQHLLVVKSNEVKKQEHCKTGDARTSSSYQMGLAYPKTISVSAPDHEETLKTDDEKKNQLKMAPECQLSVIDILEDDEPISSFRNSLAHEAHVAFSIEGLGKVETETPVHSPVVHSRSFLHCCSSPSKDTKGANSSKDLKSEMVNLEYDLDAMMRDVDLPFSRSFAEQPSCLKKRVGSFSKQKLAFEELKLFNDSDNSLHDYLVDDELFYGNEDRNEAPWNASGILVDNIPDGSGFHLSDKDWMDPIYKSADFLNSLIYRKKHATFDGLDQPEKRTIMRKAGRLEPIESPVPNFKHHKSENVSNFILPDMTWHCSIGSDHDFWDHNDQLGDSCLITEDARESSSLQSEESCSSAAVRGKLERTLLNLKEMEVMRDSNDIFNSECDCSEKNIPPRARSCDKWNTSLKWQINEPEKLTRMLNPSRSTQVPQLHAAPKKRLKPDGSRYFEAEYDLGGKSSRRDSFSETSGAAKHVSSGGRIWNEDLFRATGNTRSESSRSCFERSSVQSTFQVSTLEEKSHKPLDAHGCSTPQKENIPWQADENSGVQLSDDGKFQLQRDDFSGSKSLSSEDGKSTDASDSKVKHRDCEERTCKTPNMVESEKETNCFQPPEDVPSLETSNIFDAKQWNADRKCQLAQTALLCQTGFGDIEVDQQPKQRTTGSDSQNTADPTCPVMMVGSCVMQLLCVRMLKEVYSMVTGKQACEWFEENLFHYKTNYEI